MESHAGRRSSGADVCYTVLGSSPGGSAITVAHCRACPLDYLLLISPSKADGRRTGRSARLAVDGDKQSDQDTG